MLGVDSEQLNPFQKEIYQITVENTVIIVEIMGNIHPDDNLLEEIAGELQGIQLSGFLLLCSHLEGRLDIQLPISMIDNEIHFFLEIPAVSAVYHNAYPHCIPGESGRCR